MVKNIVPVFGWGIFGEMCHKGDCFVNLYTFHKGREREGGRERERERERERGREIEREKQGTIERKRHEV